MARISIMIQFLVLVLGFLLQSVQGDDLLFVFEIAYSAARKPQDPSIESLTETDLDGVGRRQEYLLG